MKRNWLGRVAALLVLAALVSARGDWQPGDGHKMHYPQLPDPFGWDVDATTGWIADDWQCSGSGPVTGVHLWYSWRADFVSPLSGVILQVYSDMPAGAPGNPVGYSYPDALLWERSFEPAEFVSVHAGTGEQGWYDPLEPLVLAGDHLQFYQLNITQIADPFVQEEGQIYWLAVHFIPEDSLARAGWKTSQDHWNDDAVYGVGGYPPWAELYDPLKEPPESLDMAFVIVPEPGTFVLLGLGGLALAWRRKRT